MAWLAIVPSLHHPTLEYCSLPTAIELVFVVQDGICPTDKSDSPPTEKFHEEHKWSHECSPTVPAPVSRVFIQTCTASSSSSSPPLMIKICFDGEMPCSCSMADFNVLMLEQRQCKLDERQGGDRSLYLLFECQIRFKSVRLANINSKYIEHFVRRLQFTLQIHGKGENLVFQV
jgi:hypothetical protein